MNNFYKTNIDNIKISTISAYFYKNKEYSFTRINKIFLFLRYLSKHKKFFKTKNSVKHEILKNIEDTCHNNTIKIALEQNINYDWKQEEFTDIYHYICGRVLSYIDIDNTDYKKVNIIINGFINDKSLAKEFPNRTHRNLYPELYVEINKKQAADNQIVIKASKLRTCPKCKQNLSTTKNRYARSIDEGFDLTSTCVFCGHSWAC